MLRKIAIGILIISGLAILLGCSFVVLLIHNMNSQAQEKIDQSLSVVDQHLARTSPPLPANISNDVLLPLQVGAFRRDEMLGCGSPPSSADSCWSTVYKQSYSSVYVTAQRI